MGDKKIIFFLVAMSSVSIINTTGKTSLPPRLKWQIAWNTANSLPAFPHTEKNIGVAGAFSGFAGDELIITGGANFPQKMPWEGGRKNWERSLYYANTGSPDFQWGIINDFLPGAVAYGVSVQLPEGVLCIGGCDAQQCFDDVFLIYKERGTFKISHDWPSLPVPLANATGALLNNRIYIAGGQEKMIEENATNHFFMLDLNHKDKGWIRLPSWDGGARGYAVSVAGGNGEGGGFYLFSGRNYNSSGYLEILTDGHRYDPCRNEWTRLQGTFPVMAGTALVWKEDIIFFGGVTKILPGSCEHPGFENILRVYDRVLHMFIHEEILPFAVPVTTNIAKRENRFYITSGEIKPGMRIASVYEGQIVPLEK
ncbi:kelch repeat-containing protein [uncultured Proteiniphilum sp.]|uniref:kelch repeat-containing protein n=1 Tax=uncultured Proteiniphilum sp. TaxID=497637 RepID=UPI0026075708|nr:kelch repeat-containing protein [uncultured Proteiniphilum sp.]